MMDFAALGTASVSARSCTLSHKQNGYQQTACGCKGSAIDTARTDLSSTTFCVKAGGCPGSSPTEACTISGLGHCWPVPGTVGQPDTQCQSQDPDNLDAAEYVLNFFDAVEVAPYTTRRFVYGKYFKAKCSDDSSQFECNREPADAAEEQVANVH